MNNSGITWCSSPSISSRRTMAFSRWKTQRPSYVLCDWDTAYRSKLYLMFSLFNVRYVIPSLFHWMHNVRCCFVVLFHCILWYCIYFFFTVSLSCASIVSLSCSTVSILCFISFVLCSAKQYCSRHTIFIVLIVCIALAIDILIHLLIYACSFRKKCIQVLIAFYITPACTKLLSLGFILNTAAYEDQLRSCRYCNVYELHCSLLCAGIKHIANEI